MNKVFYTVVFVIGVFIASVAQIMLKKSSDKKYDNKISEYLNPMVISAYAIFFASTFCSIFAYKEVPLSMGPILEAGKYFFVAVLSKLILKEKINKKKILGLAVIIAGIVVYSIEM